jgi:signal peptidase II
MEKLHRLLRNNWRDIVSVCIIILVVVADQLTKAWIRNNLAVGEVLFDIGIFRVIHIWNTGAVFGIFKDHSSILLVVAVLGIIAILLLVLLLRKRWPFLNKMPVMAGIALILGGTIGNNLFDRVQQGHVTDFIDFKIWPVWNVADSSVTVGEIIIAIYLIIYIFSPGQKNDEKL